MDTRVIGFAHMFIIQYPFSSPHPSLQGSEAAAITVAGTIKTSKKNNTKLSISKHNNQVKNKKQKSPKRKAKLRTYHKNNLIKDKNPKTKQNKPNEANHNSHNFTNQINHPNEAK